jgi:hypothetical protein
MTRIMMKKMIALMAAAPDRSIEEPLSRRDSSGGGGSGGGSGGSSSNVDLHIHTHVRARTEGLRTQICRDDECRQRVSNATTPANMLIPPSYSNPTIPTRIISCNMMKRQGYHWQH